MNWTFVYRQTNYANHPIIVFFKISNMNWLNAIEKRWLASTLTEFLSVRLWNPAWSHWKRDYTKDRGLLLYRPSQCTVCENCVWVLPLDYLRVMLGSALGIPVIQWFYHFPARAINKLDTCPFFYRLQNKLVTSKFVSLKCYKNYLTKQVIKYVMTRAHYSVLGEDVW